MLKIIYKGNRNERKKNDEIALHIHKVGYNQKDNHKCWGVYGENVKLYMCSGKQFSSSSKC